MNEQERAAKIAELKQEIADYLKVKDRASDPEQIKFCDEQIAGWKAELADLEKPPVKVKKPPVKVNNDIGFDFNKEPSKAAIKAKREGKGFLESFTDLF